MPTGFEPDDLYRYQKIDEIDCVPSREAAACSILSLNREQNCYFSAIWVFPLDGSPPWQLTQGTGATMDRTPRWSPDGRCIAFLSDRAGDSPQIYLIGLQGGEAKQLSHFTQGASTLAWSPDGRQLLVTCPMQVDPALRGARAQPGQSPPADAPELAWRLPYKLDGTGYLLASEIHLFAIETDTGNSRQLTDGPFTVNSAGWSPDGARIVFTRTREGRFAHRTDVWIADRDGGNARQMSRDQATCLYPAWSPDGRWIAFAGNIDEGDAQARLWLIDVQAGTVSPLGDASIEVATGEAVRWLDSATLAFVLAERGRQHIVTLSVPDGRLARVVAGDRQLSGLARSGRRFVYAADSPVSPNTLNAADFDGGGEIRLDAFNAWWNERVPLAVELRGFRVPDGQGGSEEIDGWLVRPASADGPLPLLVDVHGGPASYAMISYHWRPYWPVLCARGWAVLALNPVGSSSYGRAFSARLRGHWGEYDLPQHLAAVDALRREGVTDERVAIAGKSYGGYLSAWAIGQTDVFRAAVVAAPVGNIETHFGVSDSGYYSDPYAMCGEPYFQREKCRELSPMQHVEKARTPTLFLQGKEDERCPRCQTEELFVTLMRSTETPTEMVLYPGGTHHMFERGKPSFREDAVRRQVEWLERWIDIPCAQANGRRSNGD